QSAGSTNQEYTIQGKESFDWKEASKTFTANYKKPVKTMTVPLGLLKFLGLFSQKMFYGARICEAMNKYPEKFESEKTWKELGQPVISLSDYTKKL
ncbi:MAG: NmrA family transcriptional regulator, partial [Ferruginibacter sp.]|nr:NmrA family transcriptional regulator [Chitinophagaceae bacterium]